MGVLRSPAGADGVARHGSGPVPVLQALGSQVHPVFMLPPLATALFGAMLAGEGNLSIVTTHLVAIFAAVYTAHVKDGYVDFYARGEDDDHPLTTVGCRLALGGAAVVFWTATLGLYFLAGPLATALTIPGWFIGYFHAPQLDTTTIGATTGYPVGIGLALLGGYAAQTGNLAATPLALAGTFLLFLTGVKIIDDGTDVAHDAVIDKPTVAVVLGRPRARRAGFFLLWAGCIAILWLVVDGILPPGAALALLVFLPVAAIATRADDETATMLLVRGMYLVLAVLVVAVWYRPLAGVGLPDIGRLGRFTYLLTELFFGAFALALLVRADAIYAAVRTIVLVYPLAYVWDWYTLEVGVFDIPLRTGIELVGIPLEEHLFMIVVPATVIGVHETLRQRESASTPPPSRGDPPGS